VTQPSAPAVTLPPAPVAAPTASASTAGAPRVDLGAASDYAVLAYAGVTSTGPTTINGRVGATNAAITGLLFNESPVAAVAAQTGVTTAQLFMDGLSTAPLSGVELGGRTIGAGVYHGGTFEVTGTVTLDERRPDALRLQGGEHPRHRLAARVNLVNGWACNVFCRSGPRRHRRHPVLRNDHRNRIDHRTGVTVNGACSPGPGGRLDSNTITVPACG
jgi:hypothetical protein